MDHIAHGLANNRMNATVHLVTPRACARVAPIWPARYAVRSADKGMGLQ
jgi:hypothetical protein